MIYTVSIILLLFIPVFLRKVGIDWLLKRRDIGIFILLFSRAFWWLLIFMLLKHWMEADMLYLLMIVLAGILFRVYQERFIYFKK